MAMQPGPRQGFLSRIVRVAFSTGGYIIVNASAENNRSDGSTPPQPSISVTAGGSPNDGKPKAVLLDQTFKVTRPNSTALDMFLPWNANLPFPTRQNVGNVVTQGQYGPIGYGSQFYQMTWLGTQNAVLVPHYEFSEYGYTGTFNPRTGQPNGDGEFFWDPPWRYRFTWYEPQGAAIPDFNNGQRCPAIDDPSNPFFANGFNGFTSLEECEAFCGAHKDYWNFRKTLFTDPPNWTRMCYDDGRFLEINTFPVPLYAGVLPGIIAKSVRVEGHWLFRIPSKLQESMGVTITVEKKGWGDFSAHGYSDVKFDKPPTLNDFDPDKNPDAPGPDFTLPPEDELPFEIKTDGHTQDVPQSWTVKSQIVPTHTQVKPHYVAITTGDNFEAPPIG